MVSRSDLAWPLSGRPPSFRSTGADALCRCCEAPIAVKLSGAKGNCLADRAAPTARRWQLGSANTELVLLSARLDCSYLVPTRLIVVCDAQQPGSVTVEYRPARQLSTEDVLFAVANPEDEEAFFEALWSAAMYLAPEDFEAIVESASRCARSEANYNAIAVTLEVIMQARRINPRNAEATLTAIPDGELTSASRDEALEVLNHMREGGRFIWP
jgi:hypothetical protein